LDLFLYERSATTLLARIHEIAVYICVRNMYVHMLYSCEPDVDLICEPQRISDATQQRLPTTHGASHDASACVAFRHQRMPSQRLASQRVCHLNSACHLNAWRGCPPSQQRIRGRGSPPCARSPSSARIRGGGAHQCSSSGAESLQRARMGFRPLSSMVVGPP
jgi:hypothetical protein